MSTCPTCGARVKPGFKFTVPMPSAKPPRLALKLSERVEAALLIPASQALGTGVVIAAAGTLITDLWIPGWEPWKVGALCGVVALGGVWWDGIRDDAKRVWYELERRFGLDLNKDGFVGDPERPTKGEPCFQPPDAWVGDKKPGRLKMAYTRHPIPFADHNEARSVARAVLARNTPFTRRGLIDSGALPDDTEHHGKIYRAMIKAKLAIKRGNGAVLNDAGREYLATCLAPPPRV